MKMEFRYRFEAAHRFLKSDSKACMTPHGHTWHAVLGLEYMDRELNSSQMTVEFSEIKKGWKKLIQETFDHSYLHNINDPIVEVLRAGDEEPRLIPFPGDPTTELVALFLFSKMNEIINASAFKDKVKVESLVVEETPTNKLTCTRAFFESEIQRYKDYQGWWQSTSVEDRSLRVL